MSLVELDIVVSVYVLPADDRITQYGLDGLLGFSANGLFELIDSTAWSIISSAELDIVEDVKASPAAIRIL
jgi:hypothetical protein